MCRRKKNKPIQDNVFIQKRKKTCGERCCEKICNFCWQKCTGRVKKKLFGTAYPSLHDYMVAGYNLGSIKDKLFQSKKESVNKKKTVDKKTCTQGNGPNHCDAFKIRDKQHSVNNVPVVKVYPRLKRPSIRSHLSNRHKSKSKNKSSGPNKSKDKLSISKERGLFVQDSKIIKSRMPKIYVKDLDLIEGMDTDDLIKKFAITPSKSKVLGKMAVDYRKGVLSIASLPRNVKQRKLNKVRMNKIIKDYEELKKKKKSKTGSLKLMERLKNMDTAELKKKFSITNSGTRALDRMIRDYKHKRLSLTKFPNKSKFNSRTLSKGRVKLLLREYQAQRKLKSPFALRSKLGPFEPLIEEIRHISLSTIKRKVKENLKL